MKRIDKKVQMMDAGTALFESKYGMGTALAGTKAEMENYGKVFCGTEIDQDQLPQSGTGCDLFLNFSTAWRTRYIACLIQDAGDTGRKSADGETLHRYAAVFKEGSRSTLLRAVVHVFLMVAIAANVFLGGHGLIVTLAGVCLIALLLYSWTVPSQQSTLAVKDIIRCLGESS